MTGRAGNPPKVARGGTIVTGRAGNPPKAARGGGSGVAGPA